jgi:hypothetical protein
MLDSIPGQVKPKTIKLEFAASPGSEVWYKIRHNPFIYNISQVHKPCAIMDVIPHNTIIVSPIHKPFAIMDIQGIRVHIASCYSELSTRGASTKDIILSVLI